MITIDTIHCYEVTRKVMADFAKDGIIESHQSGYGNLPLSDYFEDIKLLFVDKNAIELNEVKTILRNMYIDIVDIVLTEN